MIFGDFTRIPLNEHPGKGQSSFTVPSPSRHLVSNRNQVLVPLLHTLQFSHDAQAPNQTPLPSLESLLGLVLTPPTHHPSLSYFHPSLSSNSLASLLPPALCTCCLPMENPVFPLMYMIGLFSWREVMSPIKEQLSGLFTRVSLSPAGILCHCTCH